jgi:pentose-5-phosphate-3-epimerase
MLELTFNVHCKRFNGERYVNAFCEVSIQWITIFVGESVDDKIIHRHRTKRIDGYIAYCPAIEIDPPLCVLRVMSKVTAIYWYPFLNLHKIISY